MLRTRDNCDKKTPPKTTRVPGRARDSGSCSANQQILHTYRELLRSCVLTPPMLSRLASAFPCEQTKVSVWKPL